jgi:hypothetical protein
VNMGPRRCPETSVNSYHTTPRNIPEERRSHEHRGGSLKSTFVCLFVHSTVLSPKDPPNYTEVLHVATFSQRTNLYDIE